jgi:integrase
MFHRLMVGHSQGQRAVRLRVAELTDLWLADLECRVSRGSFLAWRRLARCWVKMLGRLVASEIKPFQAQAWLDGQTTWGMSTKGMAIRSIKGCFLWAVRMGYLDRQPLDAMRAPKPIRRPPATEAMIGAFLATCTEPAVRDYATVALETGARPGELFSITAAGLGGTARAASVTGKTGKRTIPLSGRSWAVLAALAKRYPEGALLRGPNGRPWSRGTLAWWFRRVGAAAGVKVVPYHLRGVFATRSLRVNGEVVTAKLMGHKGLAMLAAHYEGLDQADLKATVEKVSRARRA